MAASWDAVVADLNAAAAELERAAAHACVAAKHFEGREVPRGCAHVLAAEGHILAVRRAFERVAEAHAARSEA